MQVGTVDKKTTSLRSEESAITRSELEAKGRKKRASHSSRLTRSWKVVLQNSQQCWFHMVADLLFTTFSSGGLRNEEELKDRNETERFDNTKRFQTRKTRSFLITPRSQSNERLSLNFSTCSGTLCWLYFNPLHGKNGKPIEYSTLSINLPMSWPFSEYFCIICNSAGRFLVFPFELNDILL